MISYIIGLLCLKKKKFLLFLAIYYFLAIQSCISETTTNKIYIFVSIIIWYLVWSVITFVHSSQMARLKIIYLSANSTQVG